MSLYANFVGHLSAAEAANKATNCCLHCPNDDKRTE